MHMKMNPSLNKRGMKFAHVNVVTLPGHFADVDVPLEKTAVDVFAVTESRLDCTMAKYVLQAMFAIERIGIETEAAVQCL